MHTPSPAYTAAREPAERPRATPADAFNAARRTFLGGERLDMGRLAADLGIAKATLYRWTGPREQLLGDVLWSLAEDTFDGVVKTTPESPDASRMLEIVRRYVGVLVEAPPLRRFVHEETQTALRLLTSRAGPVQGRLVAKTAELLRSEEARGALKLRTDAETLAYAIVRMTEGFMYSDDAVSDLETAVDDVVAIVRLLVA